MMMGVRKCKQCNEGVSSNKKETAMYCSRRCKDKARKIRRQTGRTPAVYLDCKCLWCGKDFKQLKRFYISKNKHRTPKFCSLKCAYASRRGKASPLFRGPANSTRGVNWKELANSIRRRDCYQCQVCSAKQRQGTRKFPVDHVIPERLMGDFDLEPHIARNLMTVCWSCHAKKTHAEYALLQGNVKEFVARLKAMNYPELLVQWGLHILATSIGIKSRDPFEIAIDG